MGRYDSRKVISKKPDPIGLDEQDVHTKTSAKLTFVYLALQ